jgi:hypothetical protein
MPGPWTPEHRAAYEARIAQRRAAAAAGDAYETPTRGPRIRNRRRSASDARLTGLLPAQETPQQPEDDQRVSVAGAADREAVRALARQFAAVPELIAAVTRLESRLPRLTKDGDAHADPALFDRVEGMRSTVLRLDTSLQLLLKLVDPNMARAAPAPKPVAAAVQWDGMDKLIAAVQQLSIRVMGLQNRMLALDCDHHNQMIDMLDQLLNQQGLVPRTRRRRIEEPEPEPESESPAA